MLLAAAVGGCSAWDLGPEPDNYVGPSRTGDARRLTDPQLEAVSPVVPGDVGASLIPGAGVNPATMPSATLPANAPTTQPVSSTQPAAATQPSITPEAPRAENLEPGRVPVPAAVSVQDAILVGLQNNASLRVQQFSVPLRRTNEEQQRARFDPTVSGQVQGGATGTNGGRTTNSISGSLGYDQFLPTGTTVSGTLSSSNLFYSDASSTFGANVSVSQALLRGAGLDVNLASLRSAELGTKISQYQLRGFAETVVANIETAYWDLVYTERQLAIVQNGLDVAEEQLRDITERIRLGSIANTERFAAEAEVARRRQELIIAQSTLTTQRIRFLQLITPPGQPFWDRAVSLQTQPFIPQGELDPVERHVEVALRLRPEINQTKLEIQQNDLEIVQTRNGLLPRLDFFVTLGKTGFASNFGESITNLNGDGYQALAGVRGDWSPINRSALASYRASLLTKDATEESYRNLIQTVQADVRTQYQDVVRTRLQIDATRATRVASQASFETELAKFRAQRSTSLLVAQAQRDLLSSQLAEVLSVTNHLKSLVTLYRLEGSLLYRRGLQAPGSEPIPEIAWKH
jgi:outer membrane protein TolC